MKVGYEIDEEDDDDADDDDVDNDHSVNNDHDGDIDSYLKQQLQECDGLCRCYVDVGTEIRCPTRILFDGYWHGCHRLVAFDRHLAVENSLLHIEMPVGGDWGSYHLSFFCGCLF